MVSAQTEETITGTWKYRKWVTPKKFSGTKANPRQKWSPYVITLNSDKTFTNITISYPDEEEVVVKGRWQIKDGKLILRYADSSGMSLSTMPAESFTIKKLSGKRLVLIFADAMRLPNDERSDVEVVYRRFTE